MKSHTSDFKNQLTELGRELRGVITYGNTTLEEEINSITPHYEADILKSVMKQLDLELTVDIPLNTVINCQIGILVNGNYEMLNFGNYVVYKSEKQEDTNTYKLTCYDKMLYAMKENEDLGVTYPISISAYLVALANKIGLSVETQTFYNSSLTIPSELYLGQNYTYRDILDEIAQATGSVICINDNDNLEVRYPNDLGAEVTATGKDITITEHEDNKISAFKIYGSSEQETTEGYNLLGLVDGTYYPSGSTYGASITFKDGVGKINVGQQAGSFGIKIPLITPVTLKANQSYTRANNSGKAYPYITLFDSEDKLIDTMAISDNGLKVYTPTENKEVTAIFLWFSSQSYGDIKPMMVEGSYTASTMPAFEKFTYGASPNPDYPQEITNVTGNVEVKVQNKNLNPYPYKDTTKTKNGITFTDNGDGTINVNGTASSTTYFDMTSSGSTKGIKLKAGTYNVSIGASSNVRATIAKYSNISEVVAIIPINTSSTTFTIEEDTEITFVLAINNGLSANNILIKPQIEQGSTATDYVPHQEQTYSIPTQQPMRAIGEYKDTFVKVNGNWYERHYIGQVVLDGSESEWKRTPTVNNNYYFFIDDIVLNCLFNSNVIIGMSNIGITSNPYREIQGVDTIFYDSHSRTRLYAETTKAMSISDFQTWLSNNNVELIYVLATPVDLPCTEEQIEALNSLSYMTLYDGITYINSDANIEFRYVAEYETIDEEFLKDVNVGFGQKYGPINSIVLSRAAESDNVYLRNERSVQEDGLCEIKIVDNQIMNFNNRSDFLQGILDALGGLEYYINDFNSPGILYLSLLDRYSIQIGENKYKSIMLNDEVNVTTGIEEIIHTDMPEQSETDYTKADKTDRRINQTYLIVDKQNQEIKAVVKQTIDPNNPNSAVNKVSKLNIRVGKLESSIKDIADITTYGESDRAYVELTGINQSEPIMLKVHPTTTNISYLYPRNNLYPSDIQYLPNRIIRFIRTYEEDETTKTENIDYELPDDLLRYSSEVYDEFYLDYDSQTCQVIKRCGYNADGSVYKLQNEITVDYPYPQILLGDGDYSISLKGYDYGYIYVRLMAQNIYTTQFATKAEVTSEINQSAQAIDLSVNKKLTNYSTTTEMNSAITIKANEINSTVSQKVGKNEVISSINQSSEAVTINANKINLAGKTINMTTDNIAIASTNFNVNKNGTMTCKNANIKGKLTSGGDESSPEILATDGYNKTYVYPLGVMNEVETGYWACLQKGSFGAGIGKAGSNEKVTIGAESLKHLGVYNETSSSSANLRVDSAGYFYRATGSSKRWKTDITENIEERLNPKALYKLPIVQFKYKKDYLEKKDVRYGKNILGFIAEDVQKIYEPATEYDEDGQVEMWNSDVMIPAMLKLIQEQHLEIEQMKKEIEILKGGN